MTRTSSIAAAYGLRHIHLSYDNAESDRSALRLVFALFPDWEADPGEIKFTRFTDGITNTLLRAAKWRPGRTSDQVYDDAILLRAYGRCTQVLIDREKETKNHLQLAERGLAPPLLATFNNGLLYRFIRGKVCSAHDLQQEQIWRGVAQRLGEWHARMPVEASGAGGAGANGLASAEDEEVELALPTYTTHHTVKEIHSIAPGKLAPNPWTVMQKWIFALPGDERSHTDAERSRKAQLQAELHRVVRDLADLPGIGADGLVLAHCDLLCGNVIVEPKRPTDRSESSNGESNTIESTSNGHTNGHTNGHSNGHALPDAAVSASASPRATSSAQAPPFASAPTASDIETVSFIDYEYATPSPAAFDLANHFAEWGGLDCDYGVLPTRAVRRAFLREYLESYYYHLQEQASSPSSNGTRPLAAPNGTKSPPSTANGVSSPFSKSLNGVNGTASPRPNSPATPNGSNAANSSYTFPHPPTPKTGTAASVAVSDAEVDALFDLVDRFRGLPGLYWGIWALIQDLISTIDFDYERYARDRLGEYWSFRETEANGGVPKPGNVREQRWATEC